METTPGPKFKELSWFGPIVAITAIVSDNPSGFRTYQKGSNVDTHIHRNIVVVTRNQASVDETATYYT